MDKDINYLFNEMPLYTKETFTVFNYTNEQYVLDKEELDKRTDYFSIQPGVTKQLYLQSGYSWHPTRFHYGDPINISCKIFIDGKLYKTIKIKQKSLVSTRM